MTQPTTENGHAVPPVTDHGFGAPVSEAIEREQWLAARLTGVGASEAAALFGCHPFLSTFSLWAAKSGLVEPEGRGDLEYVEWGHLLQRVIADRWAAKNNVGLIDLGQYHISRSPKYPHVFATLDYLGNGRPVEVKNVGLHNAHEWVDGAPLHCQIQAQVQMMCTGVSSATLVALIGGQRLVAVEVLANEDFHAEVAAASEAFWLSVLERRMPPVDGSMATSRALRALYSSDSGETVQLGEVASTAWRMLELARKDEAHAAGRKLQAENELRALMGSATFGELPDSAGTLQLRTEVRKPEMCGGCGAEVRKGSTPRVLRLKRAAR